jgi:hypothetical protein
LNKSFLEAVVAQWHNNSEKGLSEDIFLLPSHRAVNAFLRVCARTQNSPSFLPPVFTLSEWLHDLHPCRTPSLADEMVMLFQAAQSLPNPQPLLANMSSWCETFLSDTRRLQAGGLDGLQAWKTIATHHLTGAFAEDAVLEFWKLIPALYTAFQEKLHASGYITTPQRLHLLISQLQQGQPLPSVQRIHWVGFAVLSAAEQDFLRALQKSHSVQYHIDVPDAINWYTPINQLLRDTFAAAGAGLVKYPLSQTPHITLAELPRKAAHRSLFIMDDADTPPLVVTINENALPAYLNTAAFGEGINVSAALDSRAHFIGTWLTASVRCTQSQLSEKLLALSDWAQIPPVQGETDLSPGAPDTVHRLKFLLHILQTLPATEVLAHFSQALHKTLDMLALLNNQPEWTPVMLRLHLSEIGFHLPGSPENDRQVLGLLETRALDAADVEIIDALDDRLPGQANTDTFVPFGLQVQWRLPGISERNALIAYYLFRLLGRSRRTRISFTPETASVTGAGPSRFIYLISCRLSGEKLSVQHLQVPTAQTLTSSLVIKSAEVLRFLTQQGLSASAIHTWYQQGPEEFYRKHVLGIGEPREVNTEVAADVGSLFHEVAEMLYRPLVGKTLTAPLIRDAMATLPNAVQTAFEARPFIKGGEAWLYKRLITHWAKEVLRLDENRLAHGEVIVLAGLEQRLEVFFDCCGEKIKFKGSLDRVELLGDILRVCDYKTGKGIENSNEKSAEEIFVNPKENIRRQMLLYAWMVEKSGAYHVSGATAAVLSLQHLSKGYHVLPAGDTNAVERALCDFVAEVMEVCAPATS